MQKQVTIPNHLYRVRAVAAALALTTLIGGAAAVQVHADKYDDQINALSQQNADTRGVVNGLQSQAGSYQAAIAQFQTQIDTITAQISANQTQQASLQQQITDAQDKVNRQKKYLSDDIRVMYTDGQLSTIEELATSKNLSDYVDKQEYRTSVQNKINETIKQIAVLQAQLQKQKGELDTLVTSEQQQYSQLNNARAQQQQLLSYNQGQQAAYNSQISSNNSQIQKLHAQQLAANARFIGAGPAGSGPTCGGGYPAKWCNAGQDTLIDSWGMYNRECVSYTAFRVAASGRNMPYWGGRGNANQWDDDARAAGIPVDTSPRAGDVAISNGGAYGHAMYVESVNDDGSINISQYNAALDGRYSTRSGLSTSGLVFIHFP